MQRFLSRIALAAGLVAGAVAVPHAMAGAPMVKTQAPGYYRTMVGDFEVTAISDGTVKLPMLKLMNNQPPEKIAEALKRGFLKELVETSVNTYLINTGSKLVLIDTGAAGLFGPTLGNLINNLKAAGYKPEQVDEIYITHMHPDHVGGLMAEGGIAFPNATLRIDKRDVDFWLSDANLAAAPDGNKGFFQGAMASVKPYVSAGKLKPFEGNTELVPGIRAVSTYGHTTGHANYVVESKGEKLMLWGDLMHLASVQFDDPSATIAFDSDNSAAQQQRIKAFEDAAKGGYMVGITHVAFPGLGNLRPAADGKGYVWVPLNYSSLK
jgi:glyoxylase-like metal-dependent hydrolase (beta-lactamase superfamily II)